MSDFDIRKAVLAVIDETDLATPEEIAAKVAESVPGRELRSVLAFVLRDFVRVELGRGRMASRAPERSTSAKPQRSAKVASIRDYGRRWLRDREFVGDTWKLLGDCSYENLRYLEADRVQNAARSTAAATRYGHLADLVKKHKTDRVAGLPDRVLDTLDEEWRAAA